MSELKAFDVGLGRYTEDGYPCVVAFDAEGNPRLLGDEKVYLKYEADNVIADLEESHKKEVGQLLMEIVELKEKYKELAKLHDKAIRACCDADKVIAHHNYKRCLAMARWCHSMWILLRDENETKKSVFYWRWWNIWYELAEKFKEAK